MRERIDLLSNGEMARIDAAAEAVGIPVVTLMERAGQAVADAVPYRAPVAVLCGPGNNGGDGYVAARRLAADGLAVTVHAETPPRPGSAAAHHAGLWHGPVLTLEAFRPQPRSLVIDALYGAGLNRPLAPAEGAALARARAAGCFVVAVDVPSGLSGDTGQADPATIAAARTVTFHCFKPGHWLQPGRTLCGDLRLVDIGLAAADRQAAIPRRAFRNAPALWRACTAPTPVDAHKFSRGHVLVVSGPAFRSGAARLAAQAALHAGAGLVTLAGDPAALAVHASHLTAVMLAPAEDSGDLARLLAEGRHAAAILGPAAGLEATTRDKLAVLLEAGLPVVIDADAITMLAGDPAWLAARNHAGAVLTPHEGEFRRLFGPKLGAESGLSKLERARQAASMAKSVVVLKGPDTVIAAPDGRAAINTNAGPELATAGSGDTLAGIIGALLGQGWPPFEAAAAGVYWHGAAGAWLGPGLTADELAGALAPSRPWR